MGLSGAVIAPFERLFHKGSSEKEVAGLEKRLGRILRNIKYVKILPPQLWFFSLICIE